MNLEENDAEFDKRSGMSTDEDHFNSVSDLDRLKDLKSKTTMMDSVSPKKLN